MIKKVIYQVYSPDRTFIVFEIHKLFLCGIPIYTKKITLTDMKKIEGGHKVPSFIANGKFS